MSWFCCCDVAAPYDLERFLNTGSPPASDWRRNVNNGNAMVPTQPDGSGDIWVFHQLIDSTNVVNYDNTASKLVQNPPSMDPTNEEVYGIEFGGVDVRKLTAAGATAWTTSAPTNFYADPNGVVAIDGGGGYVVCDVDFDATATETWIAHISSAGSFTADWRLVVGGNELELNTIRTDSGGNLIGSRDVFDSNNDWMYKFDSGGTLQWSYPGDANIFPPALSELITVNGTTMYHVSFSNTDGVEYVFSVSSGGTGTKQWTNSFIDNVQVSDGASRPRSLQVDGSGNYYFGSEAFKVAAINSPGLIAKFNSSGVLQWQIPYGWRQIRLDGSGFIYGTFSDLKSGTLTNYNLFSDTSANLSGANLSGLTEEVSIAGQVWGIYNHETATSRDTAIYLYSTRLSRDEAFDGGAPYSTLGQICKFEDADENFTGTATLTEVNSSGVTGSIDIDTNGGGAAADEKFRIDGSFTP